MALGLRKSVVFRTIVLKPALRAIYPSLTSQFVLLTLTTSIASAVSAYELTSVAKRIESDSFRSFEVYGTITLMYLAMSAGDGDPECHRIALFQLSGQVRKS